MGRRSVEKLVLEDKRRYGKPVPVYLKNIETNELTFFNAISSLCEHFKIKPFRYKLYLDTNRTWKDKYKRRNLRFGAPNFSWAVGP